MLCSIGWIWDGHQDPILQIMELRCSGGRKANSFLAVPDELESTQLQKKEIEKVLSERVPEPAQSKWTQSVVYMPKEDPSLRFFVDYPNLNAVTE